MEHFTKGDVMLLARMADGGEPFTPVNGSRERLAHARPFCYTARQTIQQHCVRRMVARVKPQNSSARATIRWMRPMGASPFVVSCKAFAGLTLKPRGIALFLSPSDSETKSEGEGSDGIKRD